MNMPAAAPNTPPTGFARLMPPTRPGEFSSTSNGCICLRADWSFGSTLSRYLFLEEAQDQYCGRMVAGLPVHSHEVLQH